MKLARCVGDLFIPPNRHLVGGELLYINSKRKESNNLSKLNEEADFLGLLSLVMVQ